MNKFKLCIGLPHTSEKVSTAFFDCWTLMDRPKFIYHRSQFPAGTTLSIALVRNEIVQQALQNDATHLLQIDTDETFPSDLIKRLLSHNKDIVAAKVHRRYPPFDPILYKEREGKMMLMPEKEWKGKGLIEVDATGHGCIMIKTDVFLDIEYPWYDFPDENGVTKEDVSFCAKARKAGYKIFVDADIKMGHIGSFEFNEPFYDLYKRIMFKAEEK